MANFSDSFLNQINKPGFGSMVRGTGNQIPGRTPAQTQQTPAQNQPASATGARQAQQSKTGAETQATPDKPEVANRRLSDNVRFSPGMNAQFNEQRQKAIRIRHHRDNMERTFLSCLRTEPSMDELRQAAKFASSSIWDILKKHLKEGDDEEIPAYFLGLLMKIHSEYTFEHSERVMDWTVELGEELGIEDQQELKNLANAAFFKDIGQIGSAITEIDPEAQSGLGEFVGDMKQYLRDCGSLHDIGKMLIPSEIIEKTAPLNDEEYEIIKTHPLIGVEIVKPYPSLHGAIPGIRHHHEKYDGTGYPDKLKGENIPLAARLITITDTFDAMVEDRPYRKALSTSDAVNELIRLRGRQFDPNLVFPFIRMLIRKRYVKPGELDIELKLRNTLDKQKEREDALDLMENFMEILEDYIRVDGFVDVAKLEELRFLIDS
ncbi:MAG: HD-GYP domain-containing protein [Vulcanimicrobiota bacterium]